jgi:multiple sugar transport system permease protein
MARAMAEAKPLGRREGWIPFLFLLPAFSLLALFRLIPVLASFREALYGNVFSAAGPEHVFVGLRNFEALLQDPVFWKSVKVTMLFSLVINPLQATLALGLGILANQPVRGIRFFRSIYLLPVAVSLNIVCLIWRLMLDANFGLVNGLLAAFDLPSQPFLGAESHALWSIIAVATWKGVPYWTIFFLAGLQGIPKSILEAAAIDGANSVQMFLHVTLPMLRRVILFVLVADTIINFVLFIPPFVLTGGGPQLSTNLLMLETYRKGFLFGDTGGAGAISVLLLGIMVIIVGIEFALVRPREA